MSSSDTDKAHLEHRRRQPRPAASVMPLRAVDVEIVAGEVRVPAASDVPRTIGRVVLVTPEPRAVGARLRDALAQRERQRDLSQVLDLLRATVLEGPWEVNVRYVREEVLA